MTPAVESLRELNSGSRSGMVLGRCQGRACDRALPVGYRLWATQPAIALAIRLRHRHENDCAGFLSSEAIASPVFLPRLGEYWIPKYTLFWEVRARSLLHWLLFSPASRILSTQMLQVGHKIGIRNCSSFGSANRRRSGGIQPRDRQTHGNAMVASRIYLCPS